MLKNLGIPQLKHCIGDSITSEYKREILEMLRPLKIWLGKGSTLCKKLHEQIVQQFSKTFSQSTVGRN